MIFFFGLKTASVTASLAERLREVRSSFTWSVLILPCWSITGWQLHDQLSADKPLLLSSLPHPASPHGRHGSLPCALEGCPSQLFLQIIHRLSSSILSFSDSTVYKRNWRQTDIHGGGSQRAHEFFIKVFKSFIFHSENWSPGTRKICFAKISIISLCSDFLVACCSTWSPSPFSWRPSPSPWPWSWPASTSSPPSQFSSPWFTASLCCQFFLRKLFDRDLKGDFSFDHFYPLKLNP